MANVAPKVSILVPVYNVEKYLEECLSSLVGQTLKDIEIICVNDGSTDNSLEIIKKFARNDSRIRVLDKENTGYGHSLNLALCLAKGEYIGIIEPDDFVKKTMFSKLYSLAQKHAADIVKSEFYCYTTKDKQAIKTGKFAKFRLNYPLNIQTRPSLVRMQATVWSAIYGREFLSKNNIRFLETPGASYQDTSFSFKAVCLADSIILTSKAYLYYRQDNESSSMHSREKINCICKEYGEINNFLAKNPKIKEAINSQKLIKEYAAYMWNLKRIDERFRAEFLTEFASIFKKYYDNNEITKEFYGKVSPKELSLLIKNDDETKKYFDNYIKKEELRNKRRAKFSIRINASRVSVVLFGKQIIKIG